MALLLQSFENSKNCKLLLRKFYLKLIANQSQSCLLSDRLVLGMFYVLNAKRKKCCQADSQNSLFSKFEASNFSLS